MKEAREKGGEEDEGKKEEKEVFSLMMRRSSVFVGERVAITRDFC